MSFKIGFVSTLPVKEGSETDKEKYNLECNHRDVSVEISQVKLTFGDGKYEVSGIVSSPVSIAKTLFLNGWGSLSLHDEARVMQEAAELYVKDKGLHIHEIINNWPFYKAVVSRQST